MNKFLIAIEQLKNSYFYLFAVLIGMLIAAQMQYIQHGWINPDSVIYFEAARLIALGDFHQALSVFAWPMYSACIALTHKLTALSIHQSAQLLSVLFFALTTFSFLKIIQLGGGNQKTMLAGALILFSSLYIVGDVLEMLMRDHGFWAFFLSSLVFLIRYQQNHRLFYALAWQVCALIAMLFRIEGIMFVLFLPCVLLFDQQIDSKTKILRFLKSHLLNLLIVVSIIIAMLLNPALSVKSLGRLEEVFNLQLWYQFTHHLFSSAAVMSDEVLGPFLDEYAIPGLLLTFAYVMIVKTISITGPINIALAAFAYRQQKLIKPATLMVIKATALIALVTMGLIITKVFVLSGRYIVPLALMLMLLAAFQFGKLLQGYCQQKQRLNTIVVSLLLVIMTAATINNLLPKPAAYNYIQDAAKWAKQENIVQANVLYFDVRLRYFAELPYQKKRFSFKSLKNLLTSEQINQYQYLMLSLNDKDVQQTAFIQSHLGQFVEIKRFSNYNKLKHIVIYQKQP